jgi:outer membrane immunogenic protein
MKLKQHLLASALCVLPFAASAADLPMKAPPMRMVQPIPFTWTGFYVGGSIGMIAQDTQGTDIGDGTGDGLINLAGDQYNVSGIGFIGGVNIGYNWQLAGNWVIGLEADISGTSLNRENSFDCSPCSTVSSKLNALGTVRGRFGYAFDRALLYVTGGLAYGHVENRASFDQTSFYTASTDQWKTGWTVGGGVEYAVLNNWTVRAEALYVDLGTTDANAPGCNAGCRFSFKNHFTVGRLGLNYKF